MNSTATPSAAVKNSTFRGSYLNPEGKLVIMEFYATEQKVETARNQKASVKVFSKTHGMVRWFNFGGSELQLQKVA